MTDAEIRKSGRAALAAKLPMSRVGRAVEKGETQGFMRVSVDAQTKHILGAAILGPEAMKSFMCCWTSCMQRRRIPLYSAQCIFIRRLPNFSPSSSPNWNPSHRSRPMS